MDILVQLQRFIEEATGKFTYSQWIGDDRMAVYVRASRRCFDGEMPTSINCLDIASVEVVKKFRRNGYFTRFLHAAEAGNPWPWLFMECVQNPVLLPMLQRDGWIPDPCHPLCFYKKSLRK